MWHGNIIGLEEWGEPRKHSYASAFRFIYEDMKGPISTDEIALEVEEILERAVDKNKISNSLSTSGAIYSHDSGKWNKPSNSEIDTVHEG